jgi:O-antigen ligase
MPTGIGLAIALGLPLIGAITVLGIYLNKEVIVAAAWAAMCCGAAVLVQPAIGIVAMTGGYLLAAYPSVLQDLGVLTINNLLGVCFAALLVGYVLTTRDLSFLVNRQVLVLAVIGLLLVLSSAHSDKVFPTLVASQSLGIKGKLLDRTSDMMHDFWTRLIYLIFVLVFIRTRGAILALFYTFMLVLFLAVPSALVNWWHGTLAHGFRAAASFTAGANANRLAMIALMEVACWWFWLRARPTGFRWLVASAAVAGSLLTVLATGSRSGIVGTAVLALLLQTSPRRYRVPVSYIAALTVAGAFAVMTIVPQEAWERAITFSSERSDLGATSVIKREDTVLVGLQMIRDHPFLGVGLGNFREVSRQVYLDQYFRPPHNSYIWAASEGGLFVLAGYLVLFWMTWLDLRAVLALGARDPQTVYLGALVRVVFLLYCAFAALADLWLNPITYAMVGLIVTMRQYLERLPASAAHPAMVRAA